jgi:hypothetical protein
MQAGLGSSRLLPCKSTFAPRLSGRDFPILIFQIVSQIWHAPEPGGGDETTKFHWRNSKLVS